MRHLFLIAALALLAVQSPWGQTRGFTVVQQKDIANVEGSEGKRYAICVGINAYEHPGIQDLGKARNDAQALSRVLQEQGQFDTVFLLTDDVDPRYDQMQLYPRLRNITAKLDHLGDFLTPEDLVVFSFSGHGISNSDGDGFLLPADTDHASAFETSLPIRAVTQWLQDNGVRKSLLLIDACRERVDEQASRGFTNNTLRAPAFEEAEVSAVFYATKAGWYSYEDTETEFGVFTRFVLEGLKGKADYQLGNRDGVVTFRELSTFVEEAVGNYSLRQGLKQKPYIQILGERTGDLALSSYSANIDDSTRGRRDDPEVKPDPNAFGSVALYSNVAGDIRIDGRSEGSVESGEALSVADLSVGSHFAEIEHTYGTYRNEFVVRRNKTAELANIVVANQTEVRTIGGINFVFVEGTADVEGFWIGETEITLGQFAEFVNSAGYTSRNEWDEFYRRNYDYYPVHNVSRDDCDAFADWFSRRHHLGAKLPTTAQWQFAAGGKRGTRYPWGDGWSEGNCHNESAGTPGMLPVTGSLGPIQTQYFVRDITLDGVTNLAGNVREWLREETTGSEGGRVGFVAGGSWKLSKSKQFRADYTTRKATHLAAEDLGFRLVIEE